MSRDLGEDPAGAHADVGRIAFFVLAIMTAITLALGVALVASAPFDGQARSSLGGNLITAGGIGGALILLQLILSRRGATRERNEKEMLRENMMDAAGAHLAWLVDGLAKTLWMRLAYRQEQTLDAPPPGWQGDSDILEVHRTLMWRIEVMERDFYWWKEPKNLAATDAAYYVASDIASRLGLRAHAEELERADSSVARVVGRLDTIAQRLSDGGHVPYAMSVDETADTLAHENLQDEVPEPKLFDPWEDVSDDDGQEMTILHLGEPDPTAALLRWRVAWIVQQLHDIARPVGKVKATSSLEKLPAEQYRWSVLVPADELDALTWEGRFLEASWYRRVAAVAAQELPCLFEKELRRR